MKTSDFQRIRAGLLLKRDRLQDWMEATSEEVKLEQLASLDDHAVENHIHHLDQAIEAAASESLGLCEVCDDYVETDLLEMDYTACVCLDHLSDRERRDLENELELAQSVQRTLLPQEAPAIPGLEIAAFSRPAQYVGGDYFDFFEFEGGNPGFAIADVAGHGMSASLHMAGIQALLRSLIPANVSPSEVVSKVQHLLSHNFRFNTFITLFLGAYDPTDESFRFCNAGHNPALLSRGNVTSSETEIWLGPTGPALGLLEVAAFRSESVALRSGDTLILYTDGITETWDSDGQVQFGKDRLADLVRQGSRLGARELVREIRTTLEEFTGGSTFEDDVTLLVCKVENRA
jgi:sigma-B regulation protein RsbU (phosphoserine phosphatase)